MTKTLHTATCKLNFRNTYIRPIPWIASKLSTIILKPHVRPLAKAKG